MNPKPEHLADLTQAVMYLNETHKLTGGVRGMILEQSRMARDMSKRTILCYCPFGDKVNTVAGMIYPWVVWIVSDKPNGSEDWTDPKPFPDLYAASSHYNNLTWGT